MREVNGVLRARYGLEKSDAEEGRIKRLLQNVRKRKLGAMVANPDEMETLKISYEDCVFHHQLCGVLFARATVHFLAAYKANTLL